MYGDRHEFESNGGGQAFTEEINTCSHPAYQGGVISGADVAAITDPSKMHTEKSFETGAKRDRPEGKGRFTLLSPLALRRIALRAEFGERKYGAGRNWEKGMPVEEFIDSAFRHLVQYIAGDASEDHLGAAAWNLQAAMHTEEVHPQLKFPNRCDVYDWFSKYAKHGGYSNG